MTAACKPGSCVHRSAPADFNNMATNSASSKLSQEKDKKLKEFSRKKTIFCCTCSTNYHFVPTMPAQTWRRRSAIDSVRRAHVQWPKSLFFAADRSPSDESCLVAVESCRRNRYFCTRLATPFQ